MIKIIDILDSIDYTHFIGDFEHEVSEPTQLNIDNKNQNTLMWVNLKNLSLLDKMETGVFLVPDENLELKINSNCQLIYVPNPRRAFMQVLRLFFTKKAINVISTNAQIHKNVFLGQNVAIGNNVVVEQGCKIGDHTTIDHNTVIKENTIIGANVIIGSNNTIGGAGYGYEKNEEGQFEFIPHIGNVVISDFVEIGNNSCIDRAVLGSTILEENVKVDNLVHIAHGVHVGRNSMIIANSMVAGSVVIGENAWIAPSASILNQKSIGDNALIGMGAVVLKDVQENKVFIGNPARELKTRS